MFLILLQLRLLSRQTAAVKTPQTMSSETSPASSSSSPSPSCVVNVDAGPGHLITSTRLGQTTPLPPVGYLRVRRQTSSSPPQDASSQVDSSATPDDLFPLTSHLRSLSPGSSPTASQGHASPHLGPCFQTFDGRTVVPIRSAKDVLDAALVLADLALALDHVAEQQLTTLFEVISFENLLVGNLLVG